MNKKALMSSISIAAALVVAGCGGNSSKKATELAGFPLDDMRKVITRSNVQIDKEISSDGKGSLRVTSSDSNVFRLFETGDVDVENARLIYQARVRAEDVEGQVFLVMECHFPGKGDVIASDAQTPLTASTEWTTEEVSFPLNEGENPDNVKLHLVVKGKGTVWIDDVRLLKAPLE